MSSFEQRLDEVSLWLSDYRAWEKWFELWGNRVAHTSHDLPTWERKPRPQPPVWLSEECQGYLGADEPLASACYLLERWDEHPMLILQRRRSWLTTASGRQPVEEVAKSSFVHRVHVTGLWTQARFPASPVFGIVGMQIAVYETGRFTLPAIGVMVVMTPDGEGGQQWTPATTFGVGYRICNFVPPFLKTQASLHFNLARTNLRGGTDRIHPGMTDVNLFGLSVSVAKRR